MIREVTINSLFGMIHVQQDAKGKWIIDGECSVYDGLPELFESAVYLTSGKAEECRRRIVFPALEKDEPK